jgi:hypothetical protein
MTLEQNALNSFKEYIKMLHSVLLIQKTSPDINDDNLESLIHHHMTLRDLIFNYDSEDVLAMKEFCLKLSEKQRRLVLNDLNNNNK